jgi:hypothetical protein
MMEISSCLADPPGPALTYCLPVPLFLLPIEASWILFSLVLRYINQTRPFFFFLASLFVDVLMSSNGNMYVIECFSEGCGTPEYSREHIHLGLIMV